MFGAFHALNTAGGSSSLRPRAASEGGSGPMERFWGQTLQIWGFRGKIQTQQLSPHAGSHPRAAGKPSPHISVYFLYRFKSEEEKG